MTLKPDFQTSKFDRGPFASLPLSSGEGGKRRGHDRPRMSAENQAMTLNKDSDIHCEITMHDLLNIHESLVTQSLVSVLTAKLLCQHGGKLSKSS